MKIAVFGHKSIPSRAGGIEIVVDELSTRMAEQGHEVTCFNRKGGLADGPSDREVKRATYKGVTLRTVPTIERRGLAALSSSFFAAFMTAFGRFDVVHIHAEGPAFMCWLPKLFGKRVIVTVHGLDWQRAKWGKLASTYILLGEKNAARFADRIIVLSEGVQTYFREKYGRETVFIPNGVTAPERAEVREIREKWGLEKDSYILYLGRIVPEKGEHYLIRAFREIDTDKKLVIAGGSSDTEEYYRELKELAAGDERILFTDFVSGRTLEELYSNAYVYVLPSDLEGMPLSLLEAMSYGNCCLVSDIAECSEVVGEHAVCFKKSSVDDLRKKLSALIASPERVDAYREKASSYICDRYSWEDVVERTLALYEE